MTTPVIAENHEWARGMGTGSPFPGSPIPRVRHSHTGPNLGPNPIYTGTHTTAHVQLIDLWRVWAGPALGMFEVCE